MSITPEQREARREHIGSSDVSSLFGLDPFRPAGPLDLYIEKTMEVMDDEHAKREAMEIGNELEAPLVAWAGRQVGSPVITDPERLSKVCTEHPIFASNVDALFEYLPKAGVEAKSTSMDAEWGKPGTDEVPDRVLLQCALHALVHDLDEVYVPVLIGKFGLRRELYRVPRSEAIIKAIIEKGEAFWNEHVIPRIPPVATEAPSLDTLKRIRRIPATWAESCDMSLITEWEETKKSRLDAEKAEKAAFARVLASLGDAEGMRLADGREVTYFFQNGAATIDRELLSTKYPAIYQEVSRKNQFRVCRIRKGQ